jgi:hypothetical protein
MVKRLGTRALQQRIQPKGDSADAASWIGYSKQRHIIFEGSIVLACQERACANF